MRQAVKLGLAIALLAVCAAGRAEEILHNEVQTFLDIIHGDGNFAKAGWGGAVKPENLDRLKALGACKLDSVRRAKDGSMALVMFNCDQDGKAVGRTALMTFIDRKPVSIEPVSFVEVTAGAPASPSAAEVADLHRAAEELSRKTEAEK